MKWLVSSTIWVSVGNINLRCYRADLHVHTCLSPCADLTMSPKRIVEKSLARNIDVIAICDHNSAENLHAAYNAASKTSVTILAGMEITSSEEVHLIALFDSAYTAMTLQKIVYEHLAPEKNNPEFFGEQIIVNERDEVEGYNERLLIGATDLSLQRLVEEIHRIGGLAIASHIDRESYSIIGQLGFIPEDLKLDALEISFNANRKRLNAEVPSMRKYPVVASSDAHVLEDIGKVTTTFYIAEPTVSEIKMALVNAESRKIIPGG